VRAVVVVVLMIMAACSGEDPCDRCYDADYYYENPYYCQECLQDREGVEYE